MTVTPHHRLLAAARRGDTVGVRAALADGARTETRDEELRSPLLLAVLGDHVETARALVAAGADVDARDARHDSPWLATGATGSVAMLRVLLAADPAPDFRLTDRFGATGLISAAERGHVPYVRAVLRDTPVDRHHRPPHRRTAHPPGRQPGRRPPAPPKRAPPRRPAPAPPPRAAPPPAGGKPGPRGPRPTPGGPPGGALAAGADPALADAHGTTALEHAERRGHTALAALLRRTPAAPAMPA
ncbi:ankyrin repeat domain-containing protein [Streptomyces sp. NPDC058955]|uniref:ankyrin repeat domain-containing protein n=1 Tax=Streptomyces sp. NPDC058955 TaxID=3346678 RepID=UPI0036C5C08E